MAIVLTRAMFLIVSVSTLLVCLVAVGVESRRPDHPHKMPKTMGESLGVSPDDYLNLWPLPNSIKYGNNTLFVDPSRFMFKPIGITGTSTIIMEATKRYSNIIFAWGNASAPTGGTFLDVVSIEVDSIDDTLQLGVDESYELVISQTSGSILAPTVWGVLHALETFSQLVEWNFTNSYYNVRFAPYSIKDAPRFSWRGVMIDTSRHFLSPDTILRTIDGLAYNKMNVLHWHISDAESVPIESKFYPDLTKGAYAPQGVYTQDQVLNIIDYAKKRGVRIVPEFDMPGHNHAYSFGIPDVILDCPIARPVETEFWAASFDPTSPSVYNFLEVFLSEMSNLFPDSVLHVGGDEVVYQCWNETQSIRDYMVSHNITKLSDLYVMFESRVHSMLLAFQKTPMAWDEVFTTASSVLPQNAIVQVWRGDATITKAVQQGFRVVSSGDYYFNLGFDYSTSQVQWDSIYYDDPMPIGLTSAEQSLVLGCEACMWAEQIDDFNFDQRLWFRGNVFAERLWANKISLNNEVDAIVRVIKQNCRMLQRGIACTLYESRDIYPRRDLRRVCELLIPGQTE